MSRTTFSRLRASIARVLWRLWSIMVVEEHLALRSIWQAADVVLELHRSLQWLSEGDSQVDMEQRG